MKKLNLLLIVFGLFISFQSRAQTAADTIGIKETVMNYIEGFYTADAARMEKSMGNGKL